MAKAICKTPDDVVDALGGGAAVAAMCRVSPAAVSNWCAEGWIPPAWYAALTAQLQARGRRCDPAVFRQKTLAEVKA